MSTTYSQSNYYNIMEAINDAVLHENPDILSAKSQELQSSFKHVWEDAGGVNTKIKAADFLIPVGIAAIGIVASPFIGLLGELGFLAADKALECAVIR